MTRALEPFAMLPHRFIDAEMCGDLTERQAKLCGFIVRHTSEDTSRQRWASLTLQQIATGVRWKESDDTLLRELKALRPRWFDFDSTRGQRRPYRFLMTGLAVIREPVGVPRPPHDLRTNLPNPAEVARPHAETGEAGQRDAQSQEQPPQELPQTPADLSSLTSCERGEAKASGEEKPDHVVGKTTAAGSDRSITDRLIEKVEAHGRRSPLPGEDGYLDHVLAIFRAENITTGEVLQLEHLHTAREAAAP